jgi:FkbM family methyltransferase
MISKGPIPGNGSLRDDQYRPYSLCAPQVCDNAVCTVGSSAAIVTPPQQWANAVLFAPDLGHTLHPKRYRLSFAALLHEGAIGIGVMTKGDREFYHEVPLRRKGSWQNIEIITPTIYLAGSLVVRNHFAFGQSRVQIRFVDTYELDGFACAESTPIPTLISDLSTRLMTATRAFRPNLQRANDLRPDLLASWWRPLRVELTDFLGWFGNAIVNIDPASIASFSEGLPDDLIIDLAQHLARVRPLGVMPHWTFGGFITNPDLNTHVRHSLWDAAKERGIDRPIIIKWYGGTQLHLYLDNDLSHTLFVGGCVDPNEFALLDQILKPGMVFLDGGANEGIYTLFASARVGGTGRVIAVEPSGRELGRLRGNLALNNAENVQIVEKALAERDGMVALTIIEDEHAGQNTLGRPIYKVERINVEAVGAVTIDGLVEEHALRRLDVIKLDIEGAELRALQGAAATLREMKPLLLFEMSDKALQNQGGTSSAVIRLLRDAGYRFLAFDDASGRPVPVVSILEGFSNNMVAVHGARDWGLLAGGGHAEKGMSAT